VTRTFLKEFGAFLGEVFLEPFLAAEAVADLNGKSFGCYASDSKDAALWVEADRARSFAVGVDAP
jgi:hypothetical protein